MRKMVREDILGGLKVELSKGHSLQQAMQSFYNAGYSKEEIEEDRKDENEITETKQSALYKPLPTQRISNYGEEKVHRRNTGKIILIILLFIILFALIGGLVALFLYKGQVLSWFGK